jgi:GT2 family glycosyltransferase/glycosyltransferase involved in cell wall biosynthesis
MGVIMKNRTVCVLGMHRSGTSSITRGINLLGVYLGLEENLLPPNDENKEGFWENKKIVDIQDEILLSLNSKWDTSEPLPMQWTESPSISKYKRQLSSLLQSEFSHADTWGWKDPRTCLLLPMWLDLLQELTVQTNFIIFFRNPLDVAASLKKRNKISDHEAYAMWTLYTINSLYWTIGYKKILFQYDSYLENWNSVLTSISDYLNLPWPEDDSNLINEMNRFINPNLRHSISNDEELYSSDDVPQYVKEVYRLCKALAENENSVHPDEIKALYLAYNDFAESLLKPKYKRFTSQVYWDEGEGTSEDLSILQSGIADGNYHTYKFILSVPTKEIRFDPVNIYSILSIENIKVNDSIIVDLNESELRNLHAISDNKDCLITLNSDPQIYIKTKNEIRTIEIKIMVEPLSEEIIEAWYHEVLKYQKKYSRIQDESNSLVQNYKILQENHEKLINKQKEIEEINSLYVDSNMQLKEQLEQNAQEMESIISFQTSLLQAIDTKSQEISLLKNEIELLIERNNSFIKEIEVLNQEKLNSIEINAKNLHEINHLQLYIDEQVQRISELDEQLYLIKHSDGYKFLQVYYKIREKILPQNSTITKLLKFSIFVYKNKKRLRKNLTSSNIKKFLYYAKVGSLGSALKKVKLKISDGDAIVSVEDNNEINENLLKVLTIESGKSISVYSTKEIVDVIVPIYNAYEYTQKCIETVYKNTDIPFNLYLINDCSTDTRIGELLYKLRDSARPENLKKLEIIENEENLGFVKNVNKGMSLTSNHVVLLNTDTEVPPNWLSKIIKPILDNPDISSVTPFSNSATTCSFPNFDEDNDLPENLTVDDLGYIFEKYGSSEYIELPSGIGFCMAINRKVLNEIGLFDAQTFGKGYGEENDWCLRAHSCGYKNVLIPNLFVYHKHGVSFKQHTDKSREDRIMENLRKVEEKYPFYSAWVHQFIQKDPIKAVRNILVSAVSSRNESHKEGVLFVNHTLGGGTKVYENNLIKSWINEKRIYKFHQLSDSGILIEDYNNQITYQIPSNQVNQEIFNNLIQLLNINLIYINQLVTFEVDLIKSLISNSGMRYQIFIHDFFVVCPSYCLIDNDNKYCGAVTDSDKCKTCIADGLVTEPWIRMKASAIDIDRWRESFHNFLQGAEKVIAPSQSTKNIILKYYNDINIEVKEHKILTPLYLTFEESLINEEKINIGFIGAIGENKGSSIIYDLKTLIAKEGIPVKLVVIGNTNLHQDQYFSDDGILEITGRFDNNEISNLLRKHRIGLVAIPALWPETYSYTTSEAIYSGYPVLTFDLGAPAERVSGMDGGWIIPEMDVQAIFEKIKYLSYHREEILIKHRNVIRFIREENK